ncbi:hypothetical protein RUM44_010674 [Polyplax serrata]|uniref:HEAT repeat-containing protein 2 n=1 Tax=Polyplax serrata TaxID=468196 RepID=A0ABR1APM5_POLSC
MTDLNEFFVTLNRLCSNIQSEDRKKRKQGLDELHKEIFGKGNDGVEHLFDKVFSEIEKNVWKSLYDQSEAVRDSCITLLSEFVEVLKPNKEFVGELISILLWRLGDKEVNEPSEEIRLRLITLLNTVIVKFNQCCAAYTEDMVQILSKTLIDSYPKVRQESCTCASNLACTVPFNFYNHSNKLIKPIIASFCHQHHRMRVAAIEALGKVVRWGSTKNLPTQEVFGSLAEKLFDTTPNVRSAVAKVIGDWLINLHDRYSFFSKMIPLILTSLCDELPELREEAWIFWNKAGIQYQEENEQDLKDKMDFLYEKPDHYPPNVLRPNLGCRTLVQRNLCQITGALSRELEDWKNDIRIKSAQLLCWLVLHAETDITQHTENLLLTMYKVCNQTDIRIVENIEKSAEYIAYFVSPDVYMQLVVPVIQDICTAGHLCVLAALIRGSKVNLLLPHILQIGEVLSDDSICRVRKNDYQYQLLKCVEALLTMVGKDCSQIGSHLFIVIMTVKGLAQGPLVEYAQKLFIKLSEVLDKENVTEVYRDYVQLLLEKIEPTAEAWTSVSCERFLFQLVLEESGPVIGAHLPAVINLLRKTMKADGDPLVKSKLFALMSSILIQREIVLAAVDDSAFHKFLVSFIQDVITPNLVWHAGRTAEALRTVVLACLCCAVMPQSECAKLLDKDRIAHENKLEESALAFLNVDLFSEIFSTLFPLLLNSIEDSAAKTRLLSLKTLESLINLASRNGILTPDHVNQSYPLVLKRLDDVTNDVRIAAVRYLIMMYSNLPSEYNPIAFGPHLESLYSTLLIHLDDPDEKFQSHMADVLKTIGRINPRCLYEKLNKVKTRFRNFQLCNEILDYLQNLNKSEN